MKESIAAVERFTNKTALSLREGMIPAALPSLFGNYTLRHQSYSFITLILNGAINSPGIKISPRLTFPVCTDIFIIPNIKQFVCKLPYALKLNW